MGKSYRIRTELGINKTITFDFEQDFDYLEILSLKIQQEDVYTRDCSQYGVITGRVTANNGLGIPNARVSVFIPIQNQDKDNPVITQIYPYTNPKDKNEDGYRYNLLPHEKSYSTHAATGTFPSRTDVLNDATAIEIYEKYYKYTVKTNDSGDYMIFGVPVGTHILVMDVDLSDIGEFSLTPQDLIRMGLATEAQVAGNRFKTSADLNSLPQIISITKGLEVSPLWGEASVCQIAINRVDFDLRDDANVDIQPTSVFMGSIYSTGDKFRVRPQCRPKDDMGNLCGLVAGPGQILAIRHTIGQDSLGQPILEQYQLEQNGNVIDGAGAWLTELPMNLDYYYTNEFGERTISADPKIGVPTKARYRFKIKWTQPTNLSEQTRRAYWLVPNVREYGWNSTGTQDPTGSGTINELKQLGSYYFGLDWSGYTNPSAAINCEDTFYEFEFNRVYTVSGLIDEWKKGRKGRFIGIKEIDNDDCANNVNKFPVNEAFRNFDLLFFIFSILFSILQPIGLVVLVIMHWIWYLWNHYAVPLMIYLILQLGIWAGEQVALGLAGTTSTTLFGLYFVFDYGNLGMGILHYVLAAIYFGVALYLGFHFDEFTRPLGSWRFKIPMITFPDCQMCECEDENPSQAGNQGESGAGASGAFLSLVSSAGLYIDYLSNEFQQQGLFGGNADTCDIFAVAVSEAIAGRPITEKENQYNYKVPVSRGYKPPDGVRIYEPQYGDTAADFVQGVNQYLPIGERINKFNLRQNYFGSGTNRIKVTFAHQGNNTFHYDNTITVLTQSAYESGQLISFVNPSKSKDLNFQFTAKTGTFNNILVRGVSGQSLVDSGDTITVTYCDPNNQLNSLTTQYVLPYGRQNTRTYFASDIEYFQVLTAITLNYKTVLGQGLQFYNYGFYGNSGFWAYLNNQPNQLGQTGSANGGNLIRCFKGFQDFQVCGVVAQSLSRQFVLPMGASECGNADGVLYLPNHEFFEDFEKQFVTILQRGVDPYSAKYENKYGIGKILGYPNEDDVIIKVQTKLNIPIQALVNPLKSVQNHLNPNEIFFPSYSFIPGILGSTRPDEQYKPFSTDAVQYYGALDAVYLGGYAVNYTSSPSFASAGGAVQGNAFRFPASYNYTNSATFQTQKYYSQFDKLDGGAIMRYHYFDLVSETCSTHGTATFINPPDVAAQGWGESYWSPTLKLPAYNFPPTSVTRGQTVMRTDRLPSSDYSDRYVKRSKRNPIKPGEDFSGNVSLLQQNLGFAAYLISDTGEISALMPSFGNGADMVTPDIDGLPGGVNAISTLGDCENMVSLNCYKSSGNNFYVDTNCIGTDTIENGCYVFFNDPDDLWGDIERDSNSWAEWGFRYRFFYGLCRGVLAQSFVNNWVNGSLYTFPFQVDTKYDSNNDPYSEYCSNLIYFDYKTNNFYYRSSPYYYGSASSQKFVGAKNDEDGAVNRQQLLFPTTIINLGMKASFYKEISFNPTTNAYVIDKLNSTSYADTSDLVNLFVISRICDEGFLQQVFGSASNNNNLNQLFSRPEKRVDGDLAQAMSINCEVGNVPFSPEFYTALGLQSDPVVILGFPSDNPTIGVFFSSTTEDLQIKDYLTPGLIDFRQSINGPSVATFNYNIKSQKVPFYQWNLGNNTTQNIFGSEGSTWATNRSNIFGRNYQNLDRRTIYPFQPGTSSYFIGSNTTVNDIRARGYIYTEDNSGAYSTNNGGNPNFPRTFLVGAPFHFYFGIIKGESALDKFKAKYLNNE